MAEKLMVEKGEERFAWVRESIGWGEVHEVSPTKKENKSKGWVGHEEGR